MPKRRKIVSKRFLTRRPFTFTTLSEPEPAKKRVRKRNRRPSRPDGAALLAEGPPMDAVHEQTAPDWDGAMGSFDHGDDGGWEPQDMGILTSIPYNDEVGGGSGTRRTTRYKHEQEEAAWMCLRPQLLDRRERYDAEHLQLLADYRASQHSIYQSRIYALSSHCWRCEMVTKQTQSRQVYLVTWDFCHQLEVPIVCCDRCHHMNGEGAAPYNVSPLDIGALSGTPIRALDLSRAPAGNKVYLYSWDLLQSLSDTIEACPRLALSAFCRSLMTRVSRNGLAIDLAPDTVTKHISRALHEFTILTLGMSSPDARRDLQAAAEDPENVEQSMEEASEAGEDGAAVHGQSGSTQQGGQDAQDALALQHDLLAGCPACQGSQEYLKSLVEAKIAEKGLSKDLFAGLLDGSLPLIHSMYIDGHFGLPHRASAGTSDHRPPISLILLRDDEMEAFRREPSSLTRTQRKKKGPCTVVFQADSERKKISRHNDRTGVMGAFCRHGFCLAMINMTEGETWSYGIKLMDLVMQGHGIPLTMWYDINCRFKDHAMEWAAAKWGDLDVRAASLSLLTAYPLPPFHVSCHNATCQWHNSHMRMPLVGLGAGEPPEIAWAHMRKAGHVLQYQSLSFRHVSIERMVARWNDTKLHKVIPFLVDAYVRAKTKEEEGRRLLNAVVNKMRQQGASGDLIMELLSLRPSFGGEGAVEKPPEVDYIQAWLRHEYLVNYEEHTASFKPVWKAALGERNVKLTVRTSITADIIKAEEDMASARERLPLNWQESSRDLKVGELRLWAWRLRVQQRDIVEVYQETEVLRLQEEKYLTRRDMSRRLRKAKEASRSKLGGLLEDMCYVAHHFLKACDTTGMYLSPQVGLPSQGGEGHLVYLPCDVIQSRQEAKCIEATVGGFTPTGSPRETSMFISMLKEGEYPWMSRDASNHAYGVVLHTHKDAICRAQEEQELVKMELAGCRAAFQQEIHKLQASLDSLQCHLDEDVRAIETIQSVSHYEAISCPRQRPVQVELNAGHESGVCVALHVASPEQCSCPPAIDAEISLAAWNEGARVKEAEWRIGKGLCKLRLLRERRDALEALDSKAAQCWESLLREPGDAVRLTEDDYNDEYDFEAVSESDEE